MNWQKMVAFKLPNKCTLSMGTILFFFDSHSVSTRYQNKTRNLVASCSNLNLDNTCSLRLGLFRWHCLQFVRCLSFLDPKTYFWTIPWLFYHLYCCEHRLLSENYNNLVISSSKGGTINQVATVSCRKTWTSEILFGRGGGGLRQVLSWFWKF